ncbi:MAG TPA: RES family NAD+ phosphorylase [Vicinamibacteria bacterium]|nr:RES family NAD+ phosphorylase [Vicinamibacteria bacterium]
MLGAWRLTKTKYLSTAWDGEGAKRSGGRWNNSGTTVVYTSATLSLALVEILVHVTSGLLAAYTAVPIELEESLVTTLEDKDLPANWKDDPPPAATRAIGDDWVLAGKSAALRVPSVVVPVEFNYLLNPRHSDFGRVSVGVAMPFPFDPRLR